ncbi:oligosaccharyl transferase-like protein [Leishmania mexicana MHOM/GT/2001/U1103]|uniref:dolichyl-diphosphooligosaccharide--protein glycotransferase n=1 Tax=Leishmania mexicana (strain MHOM/GT/2001/U1103) TaxID=929439 RepID=E9B5Z3_LEIMU|nr:oligosaccharyl transferase-like protein [Leishmania mexicana MHOM/GT/2001/U1103]CBZ30664.1 oligosaccharyl transferase-like protein [Leishmania mexicana MHOM/GT/2001/U1103]
MGSKGTIAAQHATKAPRLKGVPRATTAPTATGPSVSTGATSVKEGVSRTFTGVRMLLLLFSFLYSLKNAYAVRLISVHTYGYLIHEFDPWFNYRAAEYMSTHGWSAFFSWFDYMSWYPLGRPVGSTTYPGLQFTAVAIHRALAAAGIPMSLNDVCVLIPAWFGAIATALLALCTYEASGSTVAAAAAALSFSIIPAHLMRSMAGEFDNECIAVAAMLLTFYCWVRSLRTRSSWPIGVLTGVAYGYMVAAWGGYIFVLNMVAMHAGISSMVDWARSTYNPSLLRAYTLFYVVGTAIAVCVPPVGMSPFKSLEQLGALLVLVFLCGLQVCEVLRARAGVEVRSRANFKIRARVFSAMAGGAALAIALLAPRGYFGPLSARVRALFVEHTRTGNPLVDSVAEHRKTSPKAYAFFLDFTYSMWLPGTALQLCAAAMGSRKEARLFMALYSLATYYFSDRMSRLMVLAGPAAAAMTAGILGIVYEWCWAQLTGWASPSLSAAASEDTDNFDESAGEPQTQSSTANCKRGVRSHAVAAIKSMKTAVNRLPLVLRVGVAVAILAVTVGTPWVSQFQARCVQSAHSFAGPRIVFRAQLRTGEEVMVKDYLEAYEWLRDSTPRSARILAWWDYGYQITGIGNRTSLADGNTWNHEHIATIGKMLTSPVAEAHSLVRHMADYVLIWAGQSGDLMKSPHMARIGNSVYHDICPNDPLCQQFGFYRNDYHRPTPMMRASLLYNLHEAGKTAGVKVDPSLFQEVYSSKYGLVRIFKVMNVSAESKKWVADPANRVCRPPGSWICPGQYPPAKEIQEMLAHRVSFDQVDKDKKRKATYHEEYIKEAKKISGF